MIEIEYQSWLASCILINIQSYAWSSYINIICNFIDTRWQSAFIYEADMRYFASTLIGASDPPL